jgi:NADPH:quinone reductase
MVCARRALSFGGPEFLQLEEVGDSVPGPAEVVLDVRAAGADPADIYLRNGAYAIVPELPYLPRGDARGVVSVVGAGVGELSVGDSVFVGTAP